jgi:hypothetical protein
MRNHFLFISLLLVIGFSGCKRDRDPARRFTLDNATTSINCLNCKTYGNGSTTYQYSSLKTTFEVTKGKMDLIDSDSYLRIHYTFNNGGGGSYYNIAYNELTVAGSQISFDSNWLFSYCTELSLTIELFTGRGQKSKPLTITIPRPAGAN